MKLPLFLAAASLARAAAFDTAVRPFLTDNCVACHNDRSAAGGLNVSVFFDSATLETRRENWERILSRVRSGQMPPKNAPKPTSAQIDAFIACIQAEFDRMDSKGEKK
jgi:mono/diheme cytochrome c family protein